MSASINTPFSYNAGINYETWTMGRPKTMNIADDLAFITQYFSLIKTFHCAGVGTGSVVMDNTQQQVIKFLTSNSKKTVQLIMGTNMSAIAQGGFGKPWKKGLMCTSAYTDQWVQMIIKAFGSVQQTLKYLACICLGNEVDANGPPVTDKHFTDYYTKWIPDAFTNLSASLSSAGLGSIPVTSIIANYPLGGAVNLVASSVTTYINTNWTSTWNGGNPFLFFNQYTGNWGKSTNFQDVITYFTNVQTALGSAPQVFVGETGYSAENGKTREAKVINEVFSWLTTQQAANNGLNIPLCFFQAFDHSGKPKGQKEMGLFTCSGTKYKIKTGIKIPSSINTPIS